MTDFKDNLLSEIKQGDLNMRPRWQFALRSLLLVCGALLVGLIAIYLLSFIGFFLRETGVGFAPLYGLQGVMVFVLTSPWLLIGITGVFLLTLYTLIGQFAFSYQRPLIYTLVGTVFGVLVISGIIVSTSAHDRAEQFARDRGVPLLTPLYQSIDDRRTGITRGVITATTSTGFTLETRDGTIDVLVTSNTHVRPGQTFTPGDRVHVIGDVADGTVEAIGIRPAKQRPGGFRTTPDGSSQGGAVYRSLPPRLEKPLRQQ